MQLAAGAYRYRALVEGLDGYDVYALQKAVGETPDGAFGPATAGTVRAFQRKHQLADDAIAGPATQRQIAQGLIWPVQARLGTPPGLARGIVEGESGFLLGQHTAVYANGTRDVGLVQENVSPTAQNLSRAFDGAGSIARTMGVLVDRQKRYLPMRGVAGDDRKAWRYAVLAHNWPAAAEQFALGTVSSWSYVSRGARYRMDAPAPWIREIGVAGVETGYEWSEHYLQTKLIYAKGLQ